MATIHDVKKYRPSFSDSLFFDNNIWVYLFCPIANVEKDKQKLYSEFLKQANQNKCAIFVNSLVLSEFCNFWLQTEFKSWKKRIPGKSEYKKDFIPTKEFKQAVFDVKIALKKIFQVTEKGNDSFNSIDFENVLIEFGACDFNDSYYLELAKKNNWKIVTDDADLYRNNKLKVEIITSKI